MSVVFRHRYVVILYYKLALCYQQTLLCLGFSLPLFELFKGVQDIRFVRCVVKISELGNL